MFIFFQFIASSHTSSFTELSELYLKITIQRSVVVGKFCMKLNTRMKQILCVLTKNTFMLCYISLSVSFSLLLLVVMQAFCRQLSTH